jgi:hypothetical protein
MNNYIEKSADFSPDRIYRYALWRVWAAAKGFPMFIGLNPSTADETQDDPTVRRCIAYAKDWGYSGLCMTNIFAFRATDPKEMLAAKDPVGPDNDQWLTKLANQAAIKIAAWGTKGSHNKRDKIIRELIPDLNYLKLTKDGSPSHPLYLSKDLVPIPWK